MITGVFCSCTREPPTFCLKHDKEIFGLDREDYEIYRTDDNLPTQLTREP